MATGGTGSQVEEGQSKCSAATLSTSSGSGAAQEEINVMEGRLTAIPPERSACEVVGVSAELKRTGALLEEQLQAQK